MCSITALHYNVILRILEMCGQIAVHNQFCMYIFKLNTELYHHVQQFALTLLVVRRWYTGKASNSGCKHHLTVG